jgi:hypothetical protein
VSLLLALSDDFRLRGMVFWLLGDLSRGERWTWLIALLLVVTAVCTALGRHVNVLARGELQAATVGMRVRRTQLLIFALTSLLTGCAVSAAGSIGFVGLVTPHLVRLGVGSDHRVLLPASALLGGVLLMVGGPGRAHRDRATAAACRCADCAGRRAAISAADVAPSALTPFRRRRSRSDCPRELRIVHRGVGAREQVVRDGFALDTACRLRFRETERDCHQAARTGARARWARS